ncbi:class I adenylate cyclase [Shewanella sp. YIC-542]|uniref:class I adenylate cyclase n=1 Tax=Shewanella mytili TaxID=3377111 RepID=UPI00398F7651
MIDFTQQKAEIAERLNCMRLERAQALFPPLHRQLFTLIAYLMHHHHQSLPGYNGEATPHGVKAFRTDARHLAALALFKFEDVEEEQPIAPCLEGVYAMGSTASFGQHPKSDVDVWLVYDSSLDAKAIARLQQKSRMLTNWFAGFEFEVNFYLVHPTQFSRDYHERIQNEWEVLGQEHSGSAQHWLLLEEFYRSHIRLAGKPVAWWPGAKADERHLFFGDVHQLPANEYFGASLWQLYKGLEKPHKALLKVLLLEAYASNYPGSCLITDAIWDKSLAGDFSIANDPYLLLYQVIERYLKRIGDTRRLEIARRCLYLKCGIQLSNPQQAQDWRYAQLRKMVLDWEWPYSLVLTLDHCEQWHSGELQWFNAQLNELMLVSYQTLLRFASTHSLSEHFKIEDLGLLTRKLHTYFSDNEQQILLLNPLWSRSLAENHLTVIRSSTDAKSYLYRLPPEPKQFLGEVAIYQTINTAAVIAWACLNGVCDHHTRWHEYGRSRARGRRLRRVARRLLPHLANRHWRVSKMDLCQPWHYRKLLLLLNMDQDPTADWLGQGIMLDLLDSNLLSVGQQQRCLLGSIHLISLNSWGEWHCHGFHGEQALLELVSHVAPGLKRSLGKVELDVVSASKKIRPQLEHGLRRILKQIYHLIRDARDGRTLVQPLQLRDKRYGLFFDAKGMSYRDLSDVTSLYQQLVRGELQPLADSAIEDKTKRVAVPQVIRDFAVKGILQYFLRHRDNSLDVFVLDEANQLGHYVQSNVDVSELVSQLTRHYAFGTIQNMRDRFNFPQFFMLQDEEHNIVAVPFGVASEHDQSEF